MSKLVKTESAIAPADSFVDAVEKVVDGNALARPALERCPNCGQANMNDPQAQFVGACSPRCARALGVSEETLKASALAVPPEQRGLLECSARLDGTERTCMLPAGHAGMHKWEDDYGSKIEWANIA